jgi:outer membrane receptor protein involved in Fe transport
VFCNNVIRFAATGRLQTINSQLDNIAEIRTRGVDANLRYSGQVGLLEDDRLDVNLLYTYLDKLEFTPFAGAPLEQNRGQLGGDGRLGAGFKHKASGRVTYATGGSSISWQVNYLGKIRDTLATIPSRTPTCRT